MGFDWGVVGKSDFKDNLRSDLLLGLEFGNFVVNVLIWTWFVFLLNFF